MGIASVCVYMLNCIVSQPKTSVFCLLDLERRMMFVAGKVVLEIAKASQFFCLALLPYFKISLGLGIVLGTVHQRKASVLQIFCAKLSFLGGCHCIKGHV